MSRTSFYCGADLLSLLPARSPRSNKGTYGKVLLAAGSRGMAGAAILAGEAAYRCGCGIVAVCSDACNRQILQSTLPEALFFNRSLLEKKAAAFDCLGAGPGIGTDERSLLMLKTALKLFSGPAVLDADALNLFSAHEDLWELITPGRVMMTPHPGEMSRLTGLSIQDILKDPAQSAVSFARKRNVVLVLKDHRSVVTDGERLYINDSGCDGMATGGSGDVLTGMLSSFAAQRPEADLFETACLGVYVHGRAGEAAAAELGSRSMLARDIVRHISDILREGDNGNNRKNNRED